MKSNAYTIRFFFKTATKNLHLVWSLNSNVHTLTASTTIVSTVGTKSLWKSLFKNVKKINLPVEYKN